MTVTTHATVSFSFSFVFTRDLYNTHYITYFMAHSFYAYLAPPIVVGVLLTCQNLDPEYKMTAFFQMYLQEKNIVLYSGQYCSLFILSARTFFALNSRAHYSRMDSDWVSMSYHSSAGKKIILKVIPTISFLCAFIVIAMVWTLLFFKVPLLWVMKGSYFGFGSPQLQVDMHARSKNTFIVL